MEQGVSSTKRDFSKACVLGVFSKSLYNTSEMRPEMTYLSPLCVDVRVVCTHISNSINVTYINQIMILSSEFKKCSNFIFEN